MNKFTISLTLTITPYITRGEVWDLYRTSTRPTPEEVSQPAKLTYNEVMEYVWRRRLSGVDCGLPTLEQLAQSGVTTTQQEWARGTQYFGRGFSGCNLYTALLLNPDGTTSEERTDNHRAAFRLVIGKHLLGAPESHKEQEYRERWEASRLARRQNG